MDGIPHPTRQTSTICAWMGNRMQASKGRWKKMKCIDCKWCYNNETMRELYICVNGKAENFGDFVDLFYEDDCPDGENDFEDFEFDFNDWE